MKGYYPLNSGAYAVSTWREDNFLIMAKYLHFPPLHQLGHFKSEALNTEANECMQRTIRYPLDQCTVAFKLRDNYPTTPLTLTSRY